MTFINTSKNDANCGFRKIVLRSVAKFIWNTSFARSGYTTPSRPLFCDKSKMAQIGSKCHYGIQNGTKWHALTMLFAKDIKRDYGIKIHSKKQKI